MFRVTKLLAVAATAYWLFCYTVAPVVWRRVLHWHPALEMAPVVTHTPYGMPGDPVNVVLIGTEDQVVRALAAAGWHPADAITLRSSLRIVRSSVMHSSYEDAPVSTLLLFGRRQDLAFEQEVGTDARERHHVRFWRSIAQDDLARPAWFGSATFDRRVGLSHTTGQITHHIDPDVDAERDTLLSDLARAGKVGQVEWLDDFQEHASGRNGGGDPYRTDRRLVLVALAAADPAGQQKEARHVTPHDRLEARHFDPHLIGAGCQGGERRNDQRRRSRSCASPGRT
jgi:hypothetical protein